MRWIAIFEDDPGMLEVRKMFGHAHLDYLAYFVPALRRYKLFTWGKAFEEKVVEL